jgi:outer membrane protein assembly factor BamB
MDIIPKAKGKKTMKIKQISIILLIVLLGAVLSGCTNTATATNSWGNAAVAGDNVVFTNSTSVVALSTVNGSERWSYPEKAAASRLFFAAPAVSETGQNGDEQIIIGDYSGLLVSLSNNNGSTEYWRFEKALGKYIGSAVVSDNVVIAPNTDGFVYFIKLSEDGSGWTIDKVVTFPERTNIDSRSLDSNGLDAFWAAAATDGSTAYIANMDHFLYAVNISTGQKKWEADLGGVMVSTPCLSEDGTLYIGTLSSKLFAVNAADGKILWQADLPGGIWSEPVLKDGKLYVGDEAGNINIVKASNGSLEKSINEGSSVIGKGVDLGDSIVFATEDGGINAIDANGLGVWMRSLTGNLYSNLVYGNGQIYIIPTKGEKAIYAYDANGNEIWNYISK